MNFNSPAFYGHIVDRTDTMFYAIGGLGDATVLDRYVENIWLATNGGWYTESTHTHDLTDGAGHGVLYGNQFLYWTLTSSATSTTNRISVKILYRIKKIKQAELLGLILQSNQN